MKLVRDTISRDLSEAAELIAQGLQTRSINGIAFACTLRGGRRYFVNVAGVLATDPTRARGIIAALDDELRHMVQSQAEETTTLQGHL